MSRRLAQVALAVAEASILALARCAGVASVRRASLTAWVWQDLAVAMASVRLGGVAGARGVRLCRCDAWRMMDGPAEHRALGDVVWGIYGGLGAQG